MLIFRKEEGWKAIMTSVKRRNTHEDLKKEQRRRKRKLLGIAAQVRNTLDKAQLSINILNSYESVNDSLCRIDWDLIKLEKELRKK